MYREDYDNGILKRIKTFEKSEKAVYMIVSSNYKYKLI